MSVCSLDQRCCFGRQVCNVACSLPLIVTYVIVACLECLLGSLYLCWLGVWRAYWLYPFAVLRLPPACCLASPLTTLGLLVLLLLLVPRLGQMSVVHDIGWLGLVMLGRYVQQSWW